MAISAGAMLTGCTPDNSTDGNGNDGSGSNLPGRLYYESISQGHDIETGLVAYDPSTYTEELLLPGDDVRDFAISDDGQFIAIVSNSRAELVAFNRYDLDEISISDSGEKYNVPIRFSPDRSQLAYNVDYWADDDLRIKTSQGLEYHITSDDLDQITGDPPFSWDWLDDSTIVFASGNTLFKMTDLSSGQFSPVYQVSGDVDLGNVSVSNDGTRVAFTEARPSVSDQLGDVFILNFDSGSVRQMTTDARARDTIWSPDDSYIAFAIGMRDASGSPHLDKCTRVYALPVSVDSPVNISVDSFEPSVKLERILGGEREELCIRSRSALYWLED
ncbi:hypothetical protein [Saccharospirillum salsuginis]|uniref:hypothetical protein n=1 Tax=Saccharospirillum salsuginis TaxID=418750 RepID=UPI0016724868|nr:hypothetical protein [Saccharospirillum salsuginis]